MNDTQQKAPGASEGDVQKQQANHSPSYARPQAVDYAFIGVEGLLSRLGGVKKTGQGRWIAKCPAREDKTPSLSIRETEDGKILIHDFGGSDFLDILAAINLRPIQLIPPHLRRDNGYQRGQRAAPPVPWQDALQAIAFQATVILIAAADIMRGDGITATTFKQVQHAESVIQNALSACRMGGSK